LHAITLAPIPLPSPVTIGRASATLAPCSLAAARCSPFRAHPSHISPVRPLLCCAHAVLGVSLASHSSYSSTLAPKYNNVAALTPSFQLHIKHPNSKTPTTYKDRRLPPFQLTHPSSSFTHLDDHEQCVDHSSVFEDRVDTLSSLCPPVHSAPSYSKYLRAPSSVRGLKRQARLRPKVERVRNFYFSAHFLTPRRCRPLRPLFFLSLASTTNSIQLF
jgi:hypothetical protein